jgi:hypothetical protein
MKQKRFIQLPAFISELISITFIEPNPMHKKPLMWVIMLLALILSTTIIEHIFNARGQPELVVFVLPFAALGFLVLGGITAQNYYSKRKIKFKDDDTCLMPYVEINHQPAGLLDDENFGQMLVLGDDGEIMDVVDAEKRKRGESGF